MSKKIRKRKKPQLREGNSPRDKYLRQKFNRTEEEYNKAFEEQGAVCFICQEPPVSRSHHVDHDHEVEKRKIVATKQQKGVWCACPQTFSLDTDNRLHFTETGKTKPEAMAKVRRKLLRLSTRGILCWQCNRALQKFRDSEHRLLRAYIYIKHYKEFMAGLKEKGSAFYE